jgi:hypothetical protein
VKYGKMIFELGKMEECLGSIPYESWLTMLGFRSIESSLIIEGKLWGMMEGGEICVEICV